MAAHFSIFKQGSAKFSLYNIIFHLILLFISLESLTSGKKLKKMNLLEYSTVWSLSHYKNNTIRLFISHVPEYNSIIIVYTQTNVLKSHIRYYSFNSLVTFPFGLIYKYS